MKGYLAMAMMMGAMAGMSAPMYDPYGRSSGRGNKKPESKKTFEQRMSDFSLQIVKHNAQKGHEFKNWKVYEVRGVEIVSSNLKNAHKTFIRIMKENDLTEADF